jgi:hypothetical protein
VPNLDAMSRGTTRLSRPLNFLHRAGLASLRHENRMGEGRAPVRTHAGNMVVLCPADSCRRGRHERSSENM